MAWGLESTAGLNLACVNSSLILQNFGGALLTGNGLHHLQEGILFVPIGLRQQRSMCTRPPIPSEKRWVEPHIFWKQSLTLQPRAAAGLEHAGPWATLVPHAGWVSSPAQGFCAWRWSLFTEKMFCPLKHPVYECCVFFYFSVLAPRPVCSVRDHCLWPGSLSVACVCSPFHGRLQLAKIPCWLVARRPAHQPDGSHSILRGGTLPSACFGEGILSLGFSHSLDFFFSPRLKIVVWLYLVVGV